MNYDIIVNEDLEGWDIIELDGIQTEDENEGSVIATFYDIGKAKAYWYLLNS